MDTCPKRANRAEGKQSQLCASLTKLGQLHASTRALKSARPRPAVIFTDRQTDALSDSNFSEVVRGTLGSKKARGDPN